MRRGAWIKDSFAQTYCLISKQALNQQAHGKLWGSKCKGGGVTGQEVGHQNSFVIENRSSISTGSLRASCQQKKHAAYVKRQRRRASNRELKRLTLLDSELFPRIWQIEVSSFLFTCRALFIFPPVCNPLHLHLFAACDG